MSNANRRGRVDREQGQRDIGRYLTFAEDDGLTIQRVILTHVRVDFVVGYLELRDRVGCGEAGGTGGVGRRSCGHGDPASKKRGYNKQQIPLPHHWRVIPSFLRTSGMTI